MSSYQPTDGHGNGTLSQAPRTSADQITPTTHIGQTSSATQTNVTIAMETREGDEELMFKIVKLPKTAADKSWHRPAEKGDWEFVPGTDLSPAVLGQPEPHKLVIFRRKQDNHRAQEMRIFPSHAELDWNDPDDIATLNKYRDQVIGRTDGVGKIGAPWTQLERDALEDILKEEFSTERANGSTIDWSKVTKSLATRFSDLIQEKGSDMAQATKMVDDVERGHFKTPRKLAEDRVGPVKRTPKNVENAAKTFASIVKLIQDNTPANARVRRVDPTKARVRYTPEYLAKKAEKRKAFENGEISEIETREDTPSKESKRAHKEPAAKKKKNDSRGSRMDPPPSPSPGGDNDEQSFEEFMNSLPKSMQN